MVVMRAVVAVFIVLCVCACGEAPDATKAVTADGKVDGARLYGMYCELCHGADGQLNMNGAKDLAASSLTRDEMLGIVTYGRNTMVAYNTVLDAAQIEAVVDHVRSFKKSE